MKIAAILFAAVVTVNAHTVDDVCRDKQDGNYALSSDCKPEYVACTAGKGIELNCGPGMAFDEKNDRCEFVQDMEKCADSSPAYLCRREESLPDPSPQAKTEFGVCSHKWLYCAAAGFEPIERQCPTGLFYDMEKDQCLNKDEILACAGPAKEIVTASSPSPAKLPIVSPVKLPSLPLPSAPFADAAPSIVGCSITGIQEDNSPEAMTPFGVCSQKWYHCSGVGAIPAELSCPGDLYYDIDKSVCLHRPDVQACVGPVSDVRPILPAAAGIRVNDSGKERNLNEFCSSKLDGTYVWEVTCSKTFAVCKDKLGYMITCPDLNLFQPSTKQCVPEQLCKV